MKTNHVIRIRVIILLSEPRDDSDRGSKESPKLAKMSKYGIRCVFISPFAHPVCPSLLRDDRPKHISDRVNFPISEKKEVRRKEHRTTSKRHSVSTNPANGDPAGNQFLPILFFLFF